MDWSAGSGLNINKVMLAIQRENPQAFSRNNINLLQRGPILRMPQRDDVNSVSSAVASSEVNRQIDAFQSRQGISMASATVPLVSGESTAMELAPDSQIEEEPLPELPAEDEPLPSELPTDTVTSQLELLPPSEGNFLGSMNGLEEAEDEADDAGTAQALREELSRKEEDLINQQQQNAYLEQRLEELESQLAESREGAVEDKSLANMEERLRQERLSDTQASVPKVVTPPKQDEPWYMRFAFWLLGLLVFAAAVAGWFMSRRGGSDTVVSELGSSPDPQRELKGEAEDVHPVPDAGSEEKSSYVEAAREDATKEMKAAETGMAATDEDEDTQTMPAGKNLAGDDEDAHVLDEESADPEIQLDLARAYISMGDKEAARVILEEVIANGSEEQQAEANKMRDLL
jgi:FimV-like protein